ncbi:MAG: AAA domain-containing protein, partial [Gemmatimonadetes bacterium]|nr:AAA domain-containing protein [Gemmatimonadota bacterium]
VYTRGPGSGKTWGEEVYDRKYHLIKPRRGDIILVRTGKQKGRAIGIVQKNDYAESGLNENSRIHVLWINKSTYDLSGHTDERKFREAKPGRKTYLAFEKTDGYKPSFHLINSLTGNSIKNGPDINEPPKPDTPDTPDTMKHSYSLNQILYGPPGTGKTWNTVNYAVAIIEDKSLDTIKDDKDARQRFDELKKNGQIAMVTFHQNFTYEDFIEGIRPVLKENESRDSQDIQYELSEGVFRKIADRANKNRTGQPEDPKYVLIIDEINRGNIARIFGELITLIEPSKRIGSKKDETTVTLPYSQDSFGMPDNLYIIGTMNTADRSIALLDTALRRRFDFVEMMPDSKHDRISTDIEGVDCQELLAAMNKRIRFLLDREHQIGHTYFMGVDDLESLEATFKNKIIPLLQEYFYDNWEKIDLVLNKNGFIQKIDIPEDLRGSLVDDNREVYELLSFDREGWKKSESYQMIYEETGEGDNDGTE